MVDVFIIGLFHRAIVGQAREIDISQLPEAFRYRPTLFFRILLQILSFPIQPQTVNSLSSLDPELNRRSSDPRASVIQVAPIANLVEIPKPCFLGRGVLGIHAFSNSPSFLPVDTHDILTF